MKTDPRALFRTAAMALALLALPLHAEVRTFISTSGQPLKGELVSVEGDLVTIRREDGQSFKLKASTFCTKDQEYFKEHGLRPGASKDDLLENQWIELRPMIQGAKNVIVGKWTNSNGTLVSSGKGEERLQIPYLPPEEYDFKITFTKTGSNCVIQILSHQGTPFIWVMSTDGMFTFHYLKGAGIGANATTVHIAGLKDGQKYTSIVRVRNDSVVAELDGQVISKWQTDYSDAVSAPYWPLRDPRCLGVGTGACKTVFQSIAIREVTGKGKRLPQ